MDPPPMDYRTNIMQCTATHTKKGNPRCCEFILWLSYNKICERIDELHDSRTTAGVE